MPVLLTLYAGLVGADGLSARELTVHDDSVLSSPAATRTENA